MCLMVFRLHPLCGDVNTDPSQDLLLPEPEPPFFFFLLNEYGLLCAFRSKREVRLDFLSQHVSAALLSLPA